MLPLKFLRLETLCILMAAVLWGTTGTIRAFLPAELAPVTIAACRVLAGAVTLWMICLVLKVPLAPLFQLPAGRVAAAGAAMAGYNLFFFYGVAQAGVGVGTAIALGSGPVWVLALEMVFDGSRPALRSVTGQIAAVLGLAILVGGDSPGQGSFPGYGAAALAGLSYGAYVYLTRGIPDPVHSSLCAAATFSVSALLLSPQLFTLPPETWALKPLALLLFLGVVSTGVAYSLFTFGLKKTPASTAVTLVLAEPLTAWVLAAAALQEEVNVLKCVGAAILLGGIRMVSTAPKDGGTSAAKNTAEGPG